MDSSVSKIYERFVANLEELTKQYRLLLDLIRKEKDLLIQADLENLNISNRQKEEILMKIRAIDAIRESNAQEFALAIGANHLAPRLLDIAKKLQGEKADQLRKIHATLEVLIKRVTELNQENEEYTKSALQHLGGALGEIKETLAGKPTYEKKGKMSQGPDKAGNFVSKEA